MGMRNVARLVLVVLVAVMCVDALAATGASAEEPLFGTESGKALSFTGTSGTVTLRGKELGVEGTVKCEKDSVKGLVLNESTLARELHIEYSGKCEQTVGGSKGTCTEPIKPVLSYGELGLLNEHVLLLVAPEKGTEFAEVKCTNGTTKLSGAVIGEFTPNDKDGKPQLGYEEKVALLSFKDKGETQEPEEIELLGSLMKGVTLKAEGFFGGKVSEEDVQLLETTGQAVVTDTKPYIFNPAGSLDFKGASEKLTVEIRNDKFKNVKITKAELNKTTYFKEELLGNKCNGVELKKWVWIFSDEIVCSVVIDTPATAKKGELAKLEIVSPVQNASYLVESK